MGKRMNLIKAITAVLLVFSLGTAGGGTARDGRAVPLDGVYNTRDLGGLKTQDGRTLREGQLIRSGEIDHLDAAGMEYLDGIGVSAIVDLRTTTEATADPAVWPSGQGPARYNFPLMEKESALIDDMRRSIKEGTATEAETDTLFREAFSYIATDYTTEIRALFDLLLAQPEGEALLFHCSGGKDRTGVATALVLSALGITREEIESDFMMSNTLKDADNTAARIAAQVNAAQGTSMPAEAVWPSVGVREVYLDEFYKSVTESYGSVDQYLHEGLGLTDDDLQALQARYLE